MGYLGGVGGVGAGCGPAVGGIGSCLGIILVLYILLVIVLRGGFF